MRDYADDAIELVRARQDDQEYGLALVALVSRYKDSIAADEVSDCRAWPILITQLVDMIDDLLPVADLEGFDTWAEDVRQRAWDQDLSAS